MKDIYFKFLYTSVSLIFRKGLFVLPGVFFFFHLYLEAQEKNTHEKIVHLDGISINENTLRMQMMNDGVSQPEIDKFIEERKLIYARESNIAFQQLKKNDNPPVPFAACSDMGAENGWGSWQATTGTAQTGSQTWAAPLPAPVAPRFNLTSGAGIDPCTPGPAPGSPTIPVVAPGFGNASIQLGQPQTNGYGAEKLVYQLTVTAQDTNFIFSYAIVIQDAGHSTSQQPFVDICIRDQNGNQVPCGCFRYTGGPSIPGFYQAACGFNTYYKPWTIVGINLSAYVGQTLTITILNVDCAQGGHWAHSYWDFTCTPLGGTASAFCIGQPASICGPYDPAIAYTYQWYQNGNPYTGPPSATSQCITPTPAIGDTFTVDVIQPSGCNFYMTYVPTPMTVTPNFNSSILCGTVNFTDVSTTSNGSPIVAWNWSFPGGSPASSTVQNPTVTYPAGNYTVTLIVTSQAGCIDTVALPLSVTGLPLAAFSSTTVCAGNTTQFTDGSTPAAGDPIVTWNWSFPSGSPASSASQNPTVTYPPGNYTATLTVTSQLGCTSTVTQSVTVNPLPLSNLSGTNVCFNNLTTFTDLSTGNNTVSSWGWNFGDGNTSALQSPTHTYGNPGTYTVTLIITNNFGCLDTNSITVVVNPLPVASFVSTTVCFGDTTCFTDQSTISSGIINGWSWNFGDPNSGSSNISNLQSPCHIFSAPGNYQVLLTVTSDSLCQSTTILPIAFNPPPVAAFTSTNVCLNFPSSFTDGSTSASSSDPLNAWNWNFGDGSPNSSLTNPSHVFSAPGNYTVTLIITTVLGCLDTISNPVTVYSPPIALFTSPDSGCSPVNHTFQDASQAVSGNIATWQWSFPGGSPATSSAQNGSSTWNVPGSYGVQLIVMTNYGCKDTLYFPNYINVFAWPTADFCVAPASASVNEPTFNFCPLWSPDVTQWSWDFGDGSAADNVSTNPVHSYSAVATNNDYYTYEICIDVQNVHGCYDNICHTVQLIPEFEFFIPNCFTPNEDFINEMFFAKSRGVKEYNIWVFDRWGNLIWDCNYEGKNINWDNLGQDGMSSACKWDGKVEGGRSNGLVQEDVYVWKVRLMDIFDKAHTYVGHVSVVK